MGEAIARLRAILEEAPPKRLAEAQQLIREATEIANAYASSRRVLASVVNRQRAALRDLERTLKRLSPSLPSRASHDSRSA